MREVYDKMSCYTSPRRQITRRRRGRERIFNRIDIDEKKRGWGRFSMRYVEEKTVGGGERRRF